MGIVMARWRDTFVPVLLDDDMAEMLDGRVSVSNGYAYATVDGRQQLVHRYLLGLRTGDGMFGDHINGDTLDCRRVNLRAVTASQSSANVRGSAASGFRGVYPCRGKWQARAKFNGRMIHLGTFETPEEAYAVSSAWRMANLPGYVSRAGA